MLYLAANGDPAASSKRPRWDLESNTVAFVNTLEQCPADHVVYVSSGAVYDGLHGDVTPATPVSPRLPYAISKLASEQYLQFFCERRGTVSSYVNVRFFGAYGPYEAARKITTKWLQALARGEREFVIRGDGRNLIDFMYVDDAVDGFLALVKAQGRAADGGFCVGHAGQHQRHRRDDGVDARRRGDGSPRRHGRRIHRVPFGATPPCAIASASRRRSRSPTASSGCRRFL